MTAAMGNACKPGRPRDAGDGIARWRLRVRGRVQGVGFRPFVYRRAAQYALAGWICNDASGVIMEVQGPSQALECLLAALYHEAPPLARVEHVEREERGIDPDALGFAIRPSTGGPINTGIAPDAALCEPCLSELFDPDNRRFRYPFINCAHCGPRYSIMTDMPYDRPNTAMSGFPLCPLCRAEYEDPADRRFHAEPIACAACGPRLALWDAGGRTQAAGDVMAAAWSLIQAGAIVAVKGIGGFHLMGDARNPAAVAALRQRKGRLDKPFAVLALNVVSLGDVARIDAPEGRLLAGADRPIVLVRKTSECEDHLGDVAPGLDRLGVMLPYTPVQYLLFHEARGRPPGTQWLHERHEALFVCTSANPGHEPLVTGNEEAVVRLAGLADAFVVHDRPIVSRCDDGVMRQDDGKATWLRCGRGQAPSRIRLPTAGPCVLGLGAMQKNTVCLTRGDEAFVSPHVGDLANRAAYHAFEGAIASLTRLLGVRPRAVACDLHPDYPSTRYAEQLAARQDIACVAVQHHHAHIAAVMAEHGLSDPVLGIALDGSGYGPGGEIWGGELLWLEGARFRRLGHLAPLALAGGDRAAREPWRMAAAALHALGRDADIARRFPGPAAAIVADMIARRINTPLTTSAGRLFDAAAGLLGVCLQEGYEGQAAMMLEGLAASAPAVPALAGGYSISDGGELTLVPALAALHPGVDPAIGAALFHATLSAGLAAWVGRAARDTGVHRVALAGGCFVNAILKKALCAALEAQGLTVYTAVRVPPNDAGLCLGQAWVAQQALNEGRVPCA